MANPFETNPHKAAAKIRVNNTLTGVCITVFGILWAFGSEKLNTQIILQFILAIPLFYVSSLSYSKIAYWKEIKLWDYFGWFTGTTAIIFVLNIIGILTHLIGFTKLTLVYFAMIWALLLVYTIINIHYNPKDSANKIFKLLYFVIMQLIFGIGILYF